MKIEIKKILCPVDFSDNANHALKYALAFASVYDSEVLLLHVMPPPIYSTADFAGVYELPAAAVQELADTCDTRLKNMAAEVGNDHAHIATRLVSGTPFLEIIKMAKEENTDLIVIGTHGRTGMSHVLIGSVAEKVVRKAPCPVLTVKNPEHEFIMP